MKQYFKFIPLYLLLFFSLQGCNKSSLDTKSPKIYKLVPVNIARIVAENFNQQSYLNINNPTNHSPEKITLNGNNIVKNVITINDHKNIPAFYIFNYANKQGFIVISADYRIAPFLSFVENGEFTDNDVLSLSKPEEIPYGFVRWVNKSIENVELAYPIDQLHVV